jgi:hypothetical protein
MVFRRTAIGHEIDWVHDGAPYPPVEALLEWSDTVNFHSMYHTRNRAGKYDSGGPFNVTKKFRNIKPSNSVTVWAANNRHPAYIGGFIPQGVLGSGDFGFDPIWSNLEVLGSDFIFQARPDKPVMGLANALFELKDVPGMLKQRFLDRGLNSIFDYHLALQFGWKPLLNDMRNFYSTHVMMKKRLNKLLEDNGKPVHRVIRRPKRSVSGLVYEQTGGRALNLWPVLPTYCYGDEALTHTKVEQVVENEDWFSGQFRYWLPDKGDMPDWQYTAMMTGRLYGLNVTPGDVYAAMPWSWLIDWFTNAGDIISNLDAGVSDRMIMDYAYVMGAQRNFLRATCTGAFKATPDGGDAVATAVLEQGWVTKRRISATPFGFGVTEDSLTPGQLSILGALGGNKLLS